MGVRDYFEIHDLAIKVWSTSGLNVNLLERVLHLVGQGEVEWRCESKPHKFHPNCRAKQALAISHQTIASSTIRLYRLPWPLGVISDILSLSAPY